MVASCYKIIMYQGEKEKITEAIWRMKIPTKIHAFLWFVTRNVILTWDSL